ncbi:flavin monoamine oxidase family protein [Aestuariivirga sp.]|uniref:flavin monoamine oxidase family protein n=1 Tax=Aestuariivirga sp. TaxID=2650926 RepID=UPI0039E2F6EF
MSDYDIAVIGAGAAGLAAGLTLQKSGLRFVVLEARSRIGGRAFTDTTSFPGIPFDHGGHWLHAAAQNPFTKIAGRLGFRYKSDIDWSHRVLLLRGGGRGSQALMREAGTALMTAVDRILEAGHARRDVAYSDVIDRSDPWFPLTRRTLNQITSHEPEDCSTLDFASYVEDGGDYPVENGYGALVEANAAGLPVSLNTPVTRIGWRGKGVGIETPQGTVTARAAIVALPVNVLASALSFDPVLPPDMLEAIAKCPMGHAEKIALLLDRPLEGFGHVYGDIVDAPPMSVPPFNLHINPFGRPIVVSHLAGNEARDLERHGEAAMVALATERMVDAFGSAIRTRILKGVATHWASEPFTLGGYSHCAPGQAHVRKAFRQPVAERLFFAGEQCSERFWSTIHGAHLSGISAAEQAIKSLK